VRFSPPKVDEGHTTLVEVEAASGVTVTGRYQGRPLLFTHDRRRDTAWALLGTVAFADLGPRPVAFTLTTAAGASRTVTRTLEVMRHDFPVETLDFPDQTEQLLNEELTRKERETLDRIFSGRTPTKYWEGAFRMPLNGSIRVTSHFATRRCYECPRGSQPTTFHGGMDMGAPEGTPVLAPAAGVVVLAERLAVRGNVIIIDHGLGVYSLFAHNSRFVANVGQSVKKGDVVSRVGNTGLSTGPHLHWELHVSGPAVEPVEWVERVMP
jgi:murein DD-endopeptidase MepM/ murein hydrolase activator NlpD